MTLGRLLGTLGRVLSSYGLAVVILLLLLLLTFLGTMEMKSSSLYDVQRKYFESVFLVHWIEVGSGTRVPIPYLPGATLLLGLLSVNLVAGGIVRLRKRATTIGVLITHLGILFLLSAGLVEHLASTKGNLALREGEDGDEYESYYDWDVVVAEHLDGTRVREHVLPFERFQGLGEGQSALFVGGGLPFDLRVSGFERNAALAAAPPGRGVDGVLLVPLQPEAEKAEHNVPGLLLTVVESSPGGATQRALLHGSQRFPWSIQVGSGDAARTYDFDLRRRRWPVPFTLRLDRFVVRYHPGTDMAKEYSSYVTQVREASQRALHITMNEPLRDHGLTFFQASFQRPQVGVDGRPGPWTSEFAVVANPADQWPKYAWFVIGFGLLFHMIWKLVLYIVAETRRRRAA